MKRKLQPDTVTDDQGRQRFHGAFTGGFSAGYFNTVGSVEGFQPAAFVSSRTNRAERKAQQIQEFTDENDGLIGGALSTQEAYDTLDKRSSEAVAKSIPGASGKAGAILQQLIVPVSKSIGKALLIKMGWKFGQAIGPRKKLAIDIIIDKNQIPSAGLDDGALTVAPRIIEDGSLRIPAPKSDYHGVDYDESKDGNSVRNKAIIFRNDRHTDKMSRYHMSDVIAHKSKESLPIVPRIPSKGGFSGFGISDDDDNVYEDSSFTDTGPRLLTNGPYDSSKQSLNKGKQSMGLLEEVAIEEDECLGGKSLRSSNRRLLTDGDESKLLASSTSTAMVLQSTDGADPNMLSLDIFIPQSRSKIISRTYDPIVVPLDYKPSPTIHQSIPTGSTTSKRDVFSDQVAQLSDGKLAFLKPEERSKLEKFINSQKESKQPAQENDRDNNQNKDKDSSDSKGDTRPMLISETHLKSTFANLSQAFKNRFVSSNTSRNVAVDSSSLKVVGLTTVDEYSKQLSEIIPTKTEASSSSGKVDAANKPKPFNLKVKRTTNLWAPDRLLCKRFNVPMPDISKAAIDAAAAAEKPISYEDKLFEQHVGKYMSEVASSGNDPAMHGNKSQQSKVEVLDFEQFEPISSSKSLFASIFDDNSSDSDEEQSEDDNSVKNIVADKMESKESKADDKNNTNDIFPSIPKEKIVFRRPTKSTKPIGVDNTKNPAVQAAPTATDEDSNIKSQLGKRKLNVLSFSNESDDESNIHEITKKKSNISKTVRMRSKDQIDEIPQDLSITDKSSQSNDEGKMEVSSEYISNEELSEMASLIKTVYANNYGKIIPEKSYDVKGTHGAVPYDMNEKETNESNALKVSATETESHQKLENEKAKSQLRHLPISSLKSLQNQVLKKLSNEKDSQGIASSASVAVDFERGKKNSKSDKRSKKSHKHGKSKKSSKKEKKGKKDKSSNRIELEKSKHHSSADDSSSSSDSDESET